MKLQVEGRAGGAQVFAIPEGESVVGRDPECSLVLDDPKVSRRHFHLLREGDRVAIRSLSRTNSLWRNGVRIREARLEPGDEIRAGRSVLRVHPAGPPGAADPAPRDVFLAGRDGLDLSLARITTEKEVVESIDQERLRLVAEVVEAIPRPGSREAFYEKLMQALFRTIDVRRAFLALRAQEDGSLRNVVSRSSEPGSRGEEIRVSRTILQRTLRSGKAQRLSDAMSDPSLARKKSVVESRIRSVLCVPVPIRGLPEGVLYADNRLRDSSFTEEDLKFLTLIGRLAGVILENLEHSERLDRENRALRTTMRDGGAYLATSRAMEPVLRKTRLVARTEASVLITGESGTGKEILAAQIHGLSDRRAGPFVAVNCAAIPETLFEAELFGIAPRSGISGAAAEGREGKFERAEAGTLFLDEIGDMSPSTQAKILRVLDERRVERLGGKRPVPVDVRVLAATNKDLEAEVRAGRFREDLFFRLRVVEIAIPPLRDRNEDILPLAEHFLRHLAGGRVVLGPAVRECLRSQAWPGNVRELRNVIERAVVLCEGRTIGPEHLPEGILPQGPAPVPLPSLAEAEKAHVAQVLASCSGCVAEAAKVLGISRTTLYAMVRRHGLDRLLDRA